MVTSSFGLVRSRQTIAKETWKYMLYYKKARAYGIPLGSNRPIFYTLRIFILYRSITFYNHLKNSWDLKNTMTKTRGVHHSPYRAPNVMWLPVNTILNTTKVLMDSEPQLYMPNEHVTWLFASCVRHCCQNDGSPRGHSLGFKLCRIHGCNTRMVSNHSWTKDSPKWIVHTNRPCKFVHWEYCCHYTVFFVLNN